MSKRLADHCNEAVSPSSAFGSALFKSDAAERCRAHQKRLLNDQHEGGRHDIAGVSTGWIEQWLIQSFHGRNLDKTSMSETAVGPRAARSDLCVHGRGGFG